MVAKPHGNVLVIAGSDSGGGAGIQADIKTITALGGYAATAITAPHCPKTPKASMGFLDVEPKFVAQQIDAVLDDIPTDVIKTGMLKSVGIIDIVTQRIIRSGIPAVVDPVMMAKDSSSLVDQSAIRAYKEILIPRATVVTPNIPEATVLAGNDHIHFDDGLEFPINSITDMEAAGKKILELGAKAVLVKGGHLEGDKITDVLVTSDKTTHFESRRIDTKNTHGTGCTLASAIATGLAQGMELEEAVIRARHYVLEAIKTAPDIGKGHGPLNHGHTVKTSQRTR